MWGIPNSRASSQICPEKAVETHGDMVYRIAILQMKNKSDADEVFQEVFLRLVRYQHRIKGEEHLKPWLIKVTMNCCKKQFGSAYRRKTVPLEENIDVSGSYGLDEEISEVYDAVQDLPGDYKDVIHLFYYEQYSVKEISRILDVTESAVKTRMFRARNMLKEVLEGGSKDEGAI